MIFSQIALARLLVFEKFTRAYLFQIARLPIQTAWCVTMVPMECRNVPISA